MRLFSYASEIFSYASIEVAEVRSATLNADSDIPEASHTRQASLSAAKVTSQTLSASRQETRWLIVCEKDERLIYIAYLRRGSLGVDARVSDLL